MMTLGVVVEDVAAALKAVDRLRPRYKNLPEGIGASPETQVFAQVVEYLRGHRKGYIFGSVRR